MKITTLIENQKDISKNLINEHGLSLFIENDGKYILFDTGRTGNFITNAKKLGVFLEKVDVVILSHGHFDHGGGLLPFFKINSKAKVYMKRKVKSHFYFHTIFFNKYIGIDKSIFDQYSDRIVFIDNFTEIMKSVYIITQIDNQYAVPKGNRYLFVKEKNNIIRDNFEHELILVIKIHDGICIFTGCSHNGTANMIKTAKFAFPNLYIKAIIGGFHLIRIPILNSLSATQNEIDEIAKMIRDKNIEKVYTCHCTGKKAYIKLRNSLGDKIEYIRTGSEIFI